MASRPFTVPQHDFDGFLASVEVSPSGDSGGGKVKKMRMTDSLGSTGCSPENVTGGSQTRSSKKKNKRNKRDLAKKIGDIASMEFASDFTAENSVVIDDKANE